MIRPRSHSFIYNVQRIILLVFYTTTAIAFSIPLARLVSGLSPDHLFPLFAALILYMILVVVIGSFIHVVSYIPFHLATAFDPIKNEIASGTIREMDQLGIRISRFTTEFFNFSFLDIAHSFIQTDGSELLSHEDMEDVKLTMEEYGMLEKSKQLEEIIRAGKLNFQGAEYHLYILPIWFGDHWLGYMGLLSGKRISRFFQKFLMEYENNFLDDQIMLVKQFSKRG
ncbi:MAG: hypothetical protein ABFS38_15805 [Bacteroidota bacterium]